MNKDEIIEAYEFALRDIMQMAERTTTANLAHNIAHIRLTAEAFLDRYGGDKG